MGGESNEHGDDESGISRVRIPSLPDPFFSSSSNWDPVVSGDGGGFSSSHYSPLAMVNPGMSCFSNLEADMPMSLLPFGDCGGGQISHFLGSDMKGESCVLGASSIGKRKQLEAESQWNKKAVEEIQEEPQRGCDQSQKKHKNDQSNKDISQSEEAPKENYIHKRARRGQATNSHSLAERVRREKISERMRLLQELVPGCNKITGKAVMLDEIINYVQSLQQQVEFLSMKLATVNPEINIDIDRIIAKDLLQSRDRNIPTLGLNPFSGFHETIPNLTTTTNPQYNSLPQTTLESELHYQMGFVSNPLSMASFSPNGQLKPEL